MAGKILKDFSEHRFESVIQDVKNYLRKIPSKIKKSDRELDNFEVFLLKFLKQCTENFDNDSHLDAVVELSEIGISALGSVRSASSCLPPLALEKILIHLATKLFARNFRNVSLLVLQHLYDRLGAQSSKKEGLEILLTAGHKTTVNFAVRLEKELVQTAQPEVFFSFYSSSVRFQLLTKDGVQLACRRATATAHSLHKQHGEEMAVDFMQHVLPVLECKNGRKCEGHADDTFSIVGLLFHYVALAKGQDKVHKQFLQMIRDQLSSLVCVDDSHTHLKSVWECCFLLLSVVHVLEQQDKEVIKKSTMECVKDVVVSLEKLQSMSIDFAEPAIVCLLDQLNNFRKCVELFTSDVVEVCDNLVPFLYCALDILAINIALLDKCREVGGFKSYNEKQNKVSISTLKNLYVCIECHMKLLKCGEGSVEVMRTASSHQSSCPIEEHMESLVCFGQIRNLLDSDKTGVFAWEEHQWLANTAYNFALAYHQQKCLLEASVMLEFVCMELAKWCVGFQEDTRLLQELEDINFFKKVSLLCSCKRKVCRYQDVHRVLVTFLQCLPITVLESTRFSSLCVLEWSKANVLLEAGQRQTLCSKVLDLSRLDQQEKMRWCKGELVQCKILGSQSLQSEVLDEMTAAIEGTEMEGNKLILADILLERAQLVRQLGSSTNEHHTPLWYCTQAVELLSSGDVGSQGLLIAGKTYFWKAVLLHEDNLQQLLGMEGNSLEDGNHDNKSVCSEIVDVDWGEFFSPKNSTALLEALESAYDHWLRVECSSESREENEILDLICVSLAFVTLHQNVGLHLKALTTLLHHCTPGCAQYHWAVASLYQLVMQHRWGYPEVAEMRDDPLKECSENLSKDFLSAVLVAKMRECVLMAECGQSEEAASILYDLLLHEVFTETNSLSYSLLAISKHVASIVLRCHRSRLEMEPEAYLQHLLHGAPDDDLGQLVTHYVPSPCQLKVDAVHILLQLADRLVLPSGQSAPLSPSHPHTSPLIVTSPWTILNELLVSLEGVVECLVDQGQWDLAHYYTKHGLSVSSGYGLRVWYCRFLLQMSKIKSALGETAQSETHLSLVSCLLHLRQSHSSSGKETHSVEGALTCKCTGCSDLSVVYVLSEYLLQSATTGADSHQILRHFETLLQNVQTVDHHTSRTVDSVQSIVSGIGWPKSKKKQYSPDVFGSVCTRHDLCCCRLHLAQEEWSSLLTQADRFLVAHTSMSSSPSPPIRSPTKAEVHFMHGVALHHLTPVLTGVEEKTSSIKETSSRGRERKRRGGAQTMSTRKARQKTQPEPQSPAISPSVDSLLRAHQLCIASLPVSMLKRVCLWLTRAFVGVCDSLAALFACQSCNVSLYLRLIERQSNVDHQNTHLPVLNALCEALQGRPQHLPLEKDCVHRFFNFSSISTVPSMMRLLAEFPEGLSFTHILSLDAHSDGLILSRLHQSGDPVVVCVGGWRNVEEQFDALMCASLASMKLKQNRAWKQERMKLDEELKSLLEEAESGSLRPWQCLLAPPVALPSVASQQKNWDVMCGDFGIPAHLLASMLRCADTVDEGEVDNIVRHFRPKCQLGDSSVSSLVEFLKSARVKDTTSEDQQSVAGVLIVDEKTQMIPWESTPTLAECTVTRMPSLLFAVNHYTQLKENRHKNFICSSKGVTVYKPSIYYLLNPRGDLSRTEQVFSAWLKQQGWKGITGRAPSKEDLMTAVSSYDLFVYIGHGGGQEYISARERTKLNCRASAILMGCSSGKLSVQGQTDGRGIILDYLLAGSPAVVGNLWDVTDKDIDRFTKTLLESLHLNGPSLQEHITVTRSTCDLPFLTGSSPIVYGLPVCFEH